MLRRKNDDGNIVARSMNVELKKIFLENWAIKLASLCLAVFLWFYVTSKGKTEIALTIPLEIRNIPQNMAVVGDVPGYLEVRVQGQERVLRDVTTGRKILGALDLSSAKAGENVLRVSPDDIKRPSDVAVTRISPYEMKVSLEPLMRRVFRLRPVLRGAPAEGYRVAGVSIRPSKITVEGPEGAVRKITGMQTMPIDIGKAKESITVAPRIDYGGRQVKILEGDISVQVRIERTGK